MPHGIVKLNRKSLKALLMLPDDYDVVLVQEDIPHNLIAVIVYSPDIPSLDISYPMPEVKPIYTKDEHGAVRLVRIDIDTEKSANWLQKVE